MYKVSGFRGWVSGYRLHGVLGLRIRSRRWYRFKVLGFSTNVNSPYFVMVGSKTSGSSLGPHPISLPNY